MCPTTEPSSSSLVMQANGRQWTKALAETCLNTGRGLVLSGCWQPPLRLGSARVMHLFNKRLGYHCTEKHCT